MDRSVSLLNTDPIIQGIPLEERRKSKYRNLTEAACCAKLIAYLTECGILPSQITVISPYVDQ
jgi:superfamily I DNA and/or RNA helicase